jgi:short-subunit dehydrogenase
MYHYAVFLKKFLPRLLEREAKSGIIAISSLSSYFSCPGGITYAATKTFVSHLVQSLNIELERTD